LKWNKCKIVYFLIKFLKELTNEVIMEAYKKTITKDNTESYLNVGIGEYYHSQTGAAEEARMKYVKPCGVKEKAKKGKIRILDVCFGLGYNSAAAVDAALAENPDCEIEVVGLEFDQEIINRIGEVNPPFSSYVHYKKLLRNLEVKEGKIKIKLIVGDARETVKSLENEYFDAVFFDPFSPKKTPEMWESGFLSEIFRVMHQDGSFATYSCARVVRENLSKAGFLWNDSPPVARRGPGTVASKWVF